MKLKCTPNTHILFMYLKVETHFNMIRVQCYFINMSRIYNDIEERHVQILIITSGRSS